MTRDGGQGLSRPVRLAQIDGTCRDDLSGDGRDSIERAVRFDESIASSRRVIQDASHALFPEQSAAVASAVIGYLEALKLQPRQVRGR
jgi:hypothetical protein